MVKLIYMLEENSGWECWMKMLNEIVDEIINEYDWCLFVCLFLYLEPQIPT